MRKLKCFFDNLMWYILYLLPVLVTLFYFGRTGDFSLSGVMMSMNVDILLDNPIFTTFSDLFGIGGIFPIFSNLDFLMYLSYFVCVYILHLMVDFLLFIPRIAHYWLDNLYGGKKND